MLRRVARRDSPTAAATPQGWSTRFIRFIWLPLALILWAGLTWALAGCGTQTAPSGAGGAGQTAPGLITTAGTSASPAFPVTLTDDAGRRVTIPKEPRRIVSTAPSNTEMLFALGLGERVVAVTDYCDFPAEAKAKPKIGGLRPNVEAIVAQTPDLVLGISGTPADVAAALEGQQIPLVILNPADFGGVLANIRAVGRLTGTTGAAEQLTGTMEQRWNAVAERARAAPAKPRVFFEIDATDPSAVSAAGPGTFIDAMITAAGGVNVVASLTPGQQYPKLSAEALLQANPELIILGDAPFGQSKQTVAQRPGWEAIGAIQRGAIVGIADPNVVSRAGPRLVDGLELVAKAIHPEMFGPPPPVPTPAGGR